LPKFHENNFKRIEPVIGRLLQAVVAIEENIGFKQFMIAVDVYAAMYPL